ncbi:hypothetical protein ACFE04_014358 [Oxalis oulophora]
MASMITSSFTCSFKKPHNNINTTKCFTSSIPITQNRRFVSISVLLSQFLLVIPNKDDAMASTLLDKYVKKKRLDPLEAYVPAVILTEFQIKDLDKTLDTDQPQYAVCRSLLRSGPASSFRLNIRAVAQYASDAGNGKAASDNVDQCLRALEELDSLLLRATRNDSGASVKSMKAEIVVALGALDSLLQTVPSEVLDKSIAIANAYRNSEEEEETQPQALDPEMKQLESILGSDSDGLFLGILEHIRYKVGDDEDKWATQWDNTGRRGLVYSVDSGRMQVTASGQREGHDWAERGSSAGPVGRLGREVTGRGWGREEKGREDERSRKRDSWADGKEESAGQSIWQTRRLGRWERRIGWAEYMARLGTAKAGRGWSGMVRDGRELSFNFN